MSRSLEGAAKQMSSFHVLASPRFNPAAAPYFIVSIKDGGLSGRDGKLPLFKGNTGPPIFQLSHHCGDAFVPVSQFDGAGKRFAGSASIQ
jgi:hypothetical protein